MLLQTGYKGTKRYEAYISNFISPSDYQKIIHIIKNHLIITWKSLKKFAFWV
jgi:hypothetical protein